MFCEDMTLVPLSPSRPLSNYGVWWFVSLHCFGHLVQVVQLLPFRSPFEIKVQVFCYQNLFRFVQDYRERDSFNGCGKDRKQEASFKSQLPWIFKSTLSAPQMKLLFHPTTGINREMGKFERISFLEAQNN
ncbi:hypothetical protein C1H46_041194 [Malus baccata]|uniref:Uncharacterized protein n=1 Tax=Malus baccata TaxID=106549 RepID=A0A540KGC7_MALBA|nr:hypothetical protein C1H46_041194 [Malus baccata]